MCFPVLLVLIVLVGRRTVLIVPPDTLVHRLHHRQQYALLVITVRVVQRLVHLAILGTSAHLDQQIPLHLVRNVPSGRIATLLQLLRLALLVLMVL